MAGLRGWVRGVLSALDLLPAPMYRERDDVRAVDTRQIGADWRMVGDDLRHAAKRVSGEQRGRQEQLFDPTELSAGAR